MQIPVSQHKAPGRAARQCATLKLRPAPRSVELVVDGQVISFRDSPQLRQNIDASIEYLISWLDDRQGDADLEDADADLEDGADVEPSLGWPEWHEQRTPKASAYDERALGKGDDRQEDAGDEREDENEHGGDIVDQPHDDQDPAEEDDNGIGDAEGLWEVMERDWPSDGIAPRQVYAEGQVTSFFYI